MIRMAMAASLIVAGFPQRRFRLAAREVGAAALDADCVNAADGLGKRPLPEPRAS
jgi:hypothetical protein